MMKHALALCIALIGLCSGCTGQIKVQPAPFMLILPDCPAPVAPTLPPLDPMALLDSPENGELLMQRDDLLRQHIAAQQATITCYRKENKHEPH